MGRSCFCLVSQRMKIGGKSGRRPQPARGQKRLKAHLSHCWLCCVKVCVNASTKCQECIKLLTMTPPGECFQLAQLTKYCNQGGLLYPSSQLYSFVKKLQDLFLECFCQDELHSDSIVDMLAVVQRRLPLQICCNAYAPTLTA